MIGSILANPQTQRRKVGINFLYVYLTVWVMSINQDWRWMEETKKIYKGEKKCELCESKWANQSFTTQDIQPEPAGKHTYYKVGREKVQVSERESSTEKMRSKTSKAARRIRIVRRNVSPGWMESLDKLTWLVFKVLQGAQAQHQHQVQCHTFYIKCFYNPRTFPTFYTHFHKYNSYIIQYKT